VKVTAAFSVQPSDAAELLAAHSMVRLITIDADGWPRVGLHVFVARGLDVEVHLANDDQQLADMRRIPRAVIEVDDVLSFSPSHWVDEHSATHADQYYRCVMLRGVPELDATSDAVRAHLRALLARHQPEGRYVGLDEDRAGYDPLIARLTVVRLTGAELSTKFKLGQGASTHARERIMDGLSEQGTDLARTTSEAIERHRPR
jgi:nitroimidazol reductase NimA-like FMN-containing flavoprotein (pyridoxamine 5'-phosphate oxidase superfamily)